MRKVSHMYDIAAIFSVQFSLYWVEFWCCDCYNLLYQIVCWYWCGSSFLCLTCTKWYTFWYLSWEFWCKTIMMLHLSEAGVFVMHCCYILGWKFFTKCVCVACQYAVCFILVFLQESIYIFLIIFGALRYFNWNFQLAEYWVLLHNLWLLSWLWIIISWLIMFSWIDFFFF